MDFTITSSSFSSTTSSVAPVSDAGKKLFSEMFGEGVVSVEMPKTKTSDFAVFVYHTLIAWFTPLPP